MLLSCLSFSLPHTVNPDLYKNTELVRDVRLCSDNHSEYLTQTLSVVMYANKRLSE